MSLVTTPISSHGPNTNVLLSPLCGSVPGLSQSITAALPSSLLPISCPSLWNTLCWFILTHCYSTQSCRLLVGTVYAFWGWGQHVHWTCTWTQLFRTLTVCQYILIGWFDGGEVFNKKILQYTSTCTLNFPWPIIWLEKWCAVSYTDIHWPGKCRSVCGTVYCLQVMIIGTEWYKGQQGACTVHVYTVVMCFQSMRKWTPKYLRSLKIYTGLKVYFWLWEHLCDQV